MTPGSDIEATQLRQGFVRVLGARENNLKNISVDIPRDALVVFTGVSGSGKSSLAFGTLYAEAQRRYLESVSPYARRLFNQMAVPEVDTIEGLPPAVALQQQRGAPTTRSSVGSVTTLMNLVRMLYSRAGDYPAKQPLLYAEAFSPNTPAGACPDCHGLGRVYDATERSMVPDDRLSIRERAIAAWPPAWHGQNLRDILVALGHDIDTPWRRLPKRDRDWILFTDEKPVVPVYAGFEADAVRAARRRKVEPSYQGTFSSAKNYLLHTFATTQSALMKKRVAQFLVSQACASCGGKRLRPASLSVRFAGLDVAQMAALPLQALADLFAPYADGTAPALVKMGAPRAEQAQVAQRIAEDLVGRVAVLLDLGLGYLALERTTPTLSPGELQRLRLATQVRSNLFGVVYVLDEPSAGLHPADTEALLRALMRLKRGGNSLFVVEHETDIIDSADWIVDVGPGAGTGGGQILYSGPPAGLRAVPASQTGAYLFGPRAPVPRPQRQAADWLRLRDLSCNNLQGLAVDLPLGLRTSVTGVSGSGKSTLVSQLLVALVGGALGQGHAPEAEAEGEAEILSRAATTPARGQLASLGGIRRLVQVDQKAIGRTPRSNLATYTGLFDQVRKLFAGTRLARARRYDAGRFSFNLAKGRCAQCQGEGAVTVELLFLPSVYAPCPSCRGARYSPQVLEVQYRDKNIAEVLDLTVDAAAAFFADAPAVGRVLAVLQEVGLGYLRLGQPATELSGGEAQRIKLATEIQRISRGDTLYVLDEPTTGLHPADVDRLLLQLERLVAAGNTVIAVEHDMQVVCSSDWVVDMGPGAGAAGGQVVAAGSPATVAATAGSPTAPYIQRHLART